MLLVTSFGSSETQPEVCEYNTQLDKLIIPFYNLFAAEWITYKAPNIGHKTTVQIWN